MMSLIGVGAANWLLPSVTFRSRIPTSFKDFGTMSPLFKSQFTILIALGCCCDALFARQWVFPSVKDPVAADFVAENNGFVVLTGSNGASFEIPLENFSKADQQFIKLLKAEKGEKASILSPGKPVTRAKDYQVTRAERIEGQLISPAAASEVHLEGSDDPLLGSSVNFTASDGWVFFEKIKPSVVVSTFLDRMLVNGVPAELDKNVRVVQYGHGAVVIPQAPDFPGLMAYSQPNLAGEAMSLSSYVKYDASKLGELSGAMGSFVLKRGYTATLAENEDGTGVSRNYVAQDHDLVFEKMPKGLDKGVRFVRVFPWRWVSKKGIAGGIHEKLGVGWFYDWNIGARSSLDLEYVAIKKKQYWPGMDQDWKAKGINHLLGFNEPDRPDQANMTVDQAIAGWPELQRTGLRLGSPSTSDGGLGWLYEFMDKADKKGLRVDFVAVHYYRAHNNPGDAKGAAMQMKGFLQGIYDRTKRPLWVTEWNNGANWTKEPDPNEKQQRDAIEAMIEMMDETPFVERYSLFNWVEPVRELVRKDGSLTPAGEVYRDHESPVFFQQPK